MLNKVIEKNTVSELVVVNVFNNFTTDYKWKLTVPEVDK